MWINSVFSSRAALFASVILAGQGIIYYSGSGKEVIPAILPWNQFPEAVGGWRSVNDMPIEQTVLERLRPDDYLNRNYASADNTTVLNFFIGYFNSRRNGRAPHSPEWCLPGAGWKSLSTTRIALPIANDSEPLQVNEYLIQKGLDEQLVIYWYHQGTRNVADDLVAQMYALPELILHGRTDTALIRIIVPAKGGDIAAARVAGRAFAESVFPLIRKHIS